jgi:hypothetical protein
MPANNQRLKVVAAIEYMPVLVAPYPPDFNLVSSGRLAVSSALDILWSLDCPAGWGVGGGGWQGSECLSSAKKRALESTQDNTMQLTFLFSSHLTTISPFRESWIPWWWLARNFLFGLSSMSAIPDPPGTGIATGIDIKEMARLHSTATRFNSPDLSLLM